MNGGHQRDEVVFLQKLKKRLRFSPCLFELTDPTDEGGSPGEDWHYWGEFAPSGIFSGVVRIECEPDDEGDISMWCWVKARCSQRHAPAPDLDRFQRFTDALALKLGEAFPLVQPQFDPVEHRLESLHNNGML